MSKKLDKEKFYHDPQEREFEYLLKIQNVDFQPNETKRGKVYTMEDLMGEGRVKKNKPPSKGSINNEPFFGVFICNPREWNEQRNLELSFTPTPDLNMEDLEFKNLLKVWELEGSNSSTVKMKGKFTSYKTDFHIQPREIGNYSKKSKTYKLYTREERWIEKSSKVRKFARKTAGKAENPYQKAKKLYQWIIENMQEKPSPPSKRGAESSLISGEGDCGDYSFIFISACRVLGIPARPVFGEFLSKKINKQRRAHAWAEFYLPKYGWIPVDPATEQGAELNPEKAKSLGLKVSEKGWFGHLDNKRVIYAKNMNLKIPPSRYKFPLEDNRISFFQPSFFIGYPMSHAPKVIQEFKSK